MPPTPRPPSRTTHQRARRAGRNSLFNFIAFLYPTILTIVVTPFVLHHVGVAGYGVFALASVFVGFLGLLDFGMGVATIRFVAEHVANDDLGRARDVVRTSLLVYAVVGILGGGVAAALGVFLVRTIFHVRPEDLAVARFVFVVAGIGFFLTMLQNALASIPPALQRYDITSAVGISLTTVTTLGTVGVLLLGFGLRGMIVVAAAQPLFAFVIYTCLGWRLLGRLLPIPLWRPALLREMSSFSWYAFIGNLNGFILFQLDKILLGSFGTTRQVAYYVVPGNIAQRIHGAAAALNAVVLPATTTLSAAADQVRIHRLYTAAVRFTALFVVTVAVAPLMLSHQILREWVGAEFAHNSAWTLRLLIGTYALLSVAVPAYFLALGYNRPGVTAAFNGSMAAINVPLVILLVPRYGNNGAAVAYLASVLPVIAFVGYVERRVLRLQRSPWVAASLRLAPLVVVEIACLALVRGMATSLGSLLLALALSTLALPVTYLVLMASDEDRAVARTLLARTHRGRSD